MDAVSIGTRRLLAAMREGDSALALLGAAVLAYGLIRRFEGSREELVYSAKLKRGQRVEIAVAGSDTQRTR